jgi:phosphatidylglycerol---prolipoprotein diacylglyceryl transferase
MGYDLVLALGIVLGFHLALSEADRKGLDPSRVFRAGLVIAGASFVAARLYVVITHADQYAGRLLAAFEVWEGGGTGSTGVYLGGFAAVLVAARWQRLSPAQLLDCAAPSVAAGLAVGRVACFLNGCCFGRATDLPWGVRYPVGSPPQISQAAAGLISPAEASLPVHPVQLYEAAYAALLFFFLWRIRRLPRRDGTLIALFFLLYPVERFFNEFLRGDSRAWVGMLSLPQAFALVSVGLACAVLASGWIHRPRPSPITGAAWPI